MAKKKNINLKQIITIIITTILLICVAYIENNNLYNNEDACTVANYNNIVDIP